MYVCASSLQAQWDAETLYFSAVRHLALRTWLGLACAAYVQDLHVLGHGWVFNCKTIHTNPEILLVHWEEDAAEAGSPQPHPSARLCLFTDDRRVALY